MQYLIAVFKVGEIWTVLDELKLQKLYLHLSRDFVLILLHVLSLKRSQSQSLKRSRSQSLKSKS